MITLIIISGTNAVRLRLDYLNSHACQTIPGVSWHYILWVTTGQQ